MFAVKALLPIASLSSPHVIAEKTSTPYPVMLLAASIVHVALSPSIIEAVPKVLNVGPAVEKLSVHEPLEVST